MYLLCLFYLNTCCTNKGEKPAIGADTNPIPLTEKLNLDTFPSLWLIEIEADFAVVRFSPGLVNLASWDEKRGGKVTVVREEIGGERE